MWDERLDASTGQYGFNKRDFIEGLVRVSTGIHRRSYQKLVLALNYY